MELYPTPMLMFIVFYWMKCGGWLYLFIWYLISLWCLMFKSGVTSSSTFTYVLQFIYWTFYGAQTILTGVFCDLSHSILKGIRVLVSDIVCIFVSLCVMVLHIRSQMTSWDSIFKPCINQPWK